MKVKNSQVWTLGVPNELNMSILDKLAGVGLPASVAYKRNKIVKELNSRFKDIVEVRNDLIKKYGKEDNGNFTVNATDGDNYNKFKDEEKELMDVEEDVNIRTLPVYSLEQMELNFYELEALLFLIDLGELENEFKEPVAETPSEEVEPSNENQKQKPKKSKKKEG